MPTLRQGLYELLGSVEIDTKEAGRTHVEPWLSQRLVIDAVAKGLSEGVHEFVILKCRQVAITTVSSVIELFWALANPGVQGAIIADRGDNLERLRRIFANLLETLPPAWRSPEHRLIVNNRNGIAFANRSVIDMLAAAANDDLGASRALNMMHATECSLWRSLAGVESLRASLARQNPHRLYIWESIANGFNWYYNFVQQAKKDRHMKFIFIGFWANPTYAIPKTDADYQIYWDGHLDEDELARAKYVKQEYNYTIKPEQIAWWRREAERSPEEYMLRHYPWHERECFIASGSGFFPAKRTLELAESLAAGPPYKAYTYYFTDKFLDSRIDQARESDTAQLRVYEPPEPNGIYVIGCDPSGGGSEDADDHAIQILRCYADRVVQVAEFQTNRPTTYQLAWVLAHLCGAYRDHVANLEVTGVGAAVLPEIRNLRQLAEQGLMNAVPGLDDPIMAMIGNVRWFLYKRQDSMSGAGNIINWKTNHDNKAMIYSGLRDSLMLRRIELRSHRLVTQMQAVIEDDGWIGAGPDTGENDDLVQALALAHWAWMEWRRPALVARNYTWDVVKGERPPQNAGTVLSQAFSEFFVSLNRRQREHRERF
jgi:hypothetical protein